MRLGLWSDPAASLGASRTVRGVLSHCMNEAWLPPQAHLHGGGRMSNAPYIDPIQHAWRQCNPHAPLPSALVQRAAPFGWARTRDSPHGQVAAEWSGTTRDVQYGLLTLATLPRPQLNQQ